MTARIHVANRPVWIRFRAPLGQDAARHGYTDEEQIKQMSAKVPAYAVCRRGMIVPG